MSQENVSSVKHFTRGGQIFFHNIRMVWQVFKQLAHVGFIALVLFNVGWFFIANSAYERYLLSKYAMASFWSHFPKKMPQTINAPNGTPVTLPAKDIVNHQGINTWIDRIKYRSIGGLALSIFLYLLVISGVVVWLRRKGKSHTENKNLRGDRLTNKEEVKSLIESHEMASDLRLAGLPLVKGSEKQHLLFDGTTGVGKSTAIKYLLEQIRWRGDRAIVYDKSCNLLEEFYHEGDVLLNPLDQRSKLWHLWNECHSASDFNQLASALIPSVPNDSNPFWVKSARMVFSALAFALSKEEKKGIPDLLDLLFSSDIQPLQQKIKGTAASALVSGENKETIDSIRAVISSYSNSLEFLRDVDEDAFSIRRWVEDDSEKHWLFMTSNAGKHESLKPLITTWLDVAISALMSMPPHPNRRLWFILDELPSLNQLPSLETGLSESRKFGGCFLLGWQNIAQVQSVYGRDRAKSISSLINTRFMYRQVDAEVAQWSSRNLGEKILDEAREGVSYGANTIRDGVNIQRLETRKPIISFSEIMQLPDLSCYVRLPQGYPICRLDFEYKNRSKRALGWIHTEESKPSHSLLERNGKENQLNGREKKIEDLDLSNKKKNK